MKLHWKLLLPVFTGSLLLISCLILFWYPSGLTSHDRWSLMGMVFMGTILILAITGVTIESLFLKPLRSLVRKSSPHTVRLSEDEIKALTEVIIHLTNTLHETQGDLGQEKSRRKQLEHALKELEERYAIELERSQRADSSKVREAL